MAKERWSCTSISPLLFMTWCFISKLLGTSLRFFFLSLGHIFFNVFLIHCLVLLLFVFRSLFPFLSLYPSFYVPFFVTPLLIFFPPSFIPCLSVYLTLSLSFLLSLFVYHFPSSFLFLSSCLQPFFPPTVCCDDGLTFVWLWKSSLCLRTHSFLSRRMSECCLGTF